jgi:hypothetical protein
VKESLFVLSATASALALAFFFLAARARGVRRSSAFFGSALVATAPVVWFFATCIEVHPLQLAVAAATVWWAVSALGGQSGAAPSALPAAFLLCGLVGTHMTGALWAPALAVGLFRGEGCWRRPRRLVPSLVVLAVFAGCWIRVTARASGGSFAEYGIETVLTEAWRPALFWREALAPGGVLVPLALLGAWSAYRRAPHAWSGALPLSALVLVLTFVPFAFTVTIAERGAYFISLVPVTGMLACQALERFGALRIPLALAALGTHVVWSSSEIREWEHDYPGQEWASALLAESGGQGLVLTSDRAEWSAIWHHSDMKVFCGRVNLKDRDFAAVKKRVSNAVGRTLREGKPVAVMRTFLESPYSDAMEISGELVEKYGQPVPGARPEYLFFEPRPSRAAQ